MKSPAPPDHRCFIAGMLASALSITSRLMRHNWRRGRCRADARQSRCAQRRFFEGDVAAPGNPVILLPLLILLALLANREALPLSSLGCAGMYSITDPPPSSANSTCHAAIDHKINAMMISLQQEFGLVLEEYSADYFDDGAGSLFDNMSDATVNDPF
jgi:hypothetical protein